MRGCPPWHRFCNRPLEQTATLAQSTSRDRGLIPSRRAEELTMHDNHIALITGANKGIGLTIAKNLARHGLTVLVGSRDLANGETAARAMDGAHNGLQPAATEPAPIPAAADRVRGEFGRLDALINNAGISHATPWEEMPGDTFEEKAQS